MDVRSELVKSNRAFALDLYERLSHSAGNLIFSPLGISSALAMAAAGAAGETAQELATALRVSLREAQLDAAHAALRELFHRNAEFQQSKAALSLSSTLWLQAGISVHATYRERLGRRFGASVQTLDFVREPESSRTQINRWASERTHGRIPDIISDSIHVRTGLVLTSAEYLRAFWQFPFDPEDTKPMRFHTRGKTLTADGMHLEKRLSYTEDALAQVLELPYRDPGLVMFVVLPRRLDGLGECERALFRSGALEAWSSRLRPTTVAVTLPRFVSVWQSEVSSQLKSLGIRNAFELGRADFSGIAAAPLALGSVYHSARIDVDEEGTEAAGATAMVMTLGASLTRTRFVADHPFLYLLLEPESGSILFLGRLERP
ncbi:MAG TPA: serpin family protein [Myxococcaceae bacterium]|nr:serpin family protein [Myxococcaceae bacterium]